MDIYLKIYLVGFIISWFGVFIYYINEYDYADHFTISQVIVYSMVSGLIWFYFILYFILEIIIILCEIIMSPMQYIKKEFFLIKESEYE